MEIPQISNELRAPADAGTCWIIIPTDGSAAASGTLAAAVSVARRVPSSPATIVLAGIAPDTGAVEYDPLELWAVCEAAEQGAFPPPMPLLRHVADDPEERTAQVLHRILLPLRRRVLAAGLPVAIRVLRDADPATDLRSLVQVGPGRTGLALADPRSLHGTLRDLTLGLLLTPPCTLYLTDRALFKIGPPAERGTRPSFMGMMRWLWQRHAPHPQ